jgi:hypothetical protein
VAVTSALVASPTVGNQPAPTDRDLRVEDIGEDLAPQPAHGASTRGADLGRRRHAGLDHQVQAVAQAEGDPLEHGPGHVAPVVGEGETDECAAGQRVGVRAAFAGEIGKEAEARAPGWDLGGERDQVAEVDTGRQRVTEPAQASGRREHHRHEVPAAGNRVAEGVHPPVRLEDRAVRGGEDHARGPE